MSKIRSRSGRIERHSAFPCPWVLLIRLTPDDGERSMVLDKNGQY